MHSANADGFGQVVHPAIEAFDQAVDDDRTADLLEH